MAIDEGHSRKSINKVDEPRLMMSLNKPAARGAERSRDGPTGVRLD
jgi:hypothetical protein